MKNKYWFKGLIFGIIAGIVVIIGAMLLRLGGANDISYYPYVFAYTILVSVIVFSIAGIIIKKNWTSLVKGLVIGVVSYIFLLLPIVVPELSYCSTLSEKGMCGLFSVTAFLIFLPAIPIGAVTGWIVGLRKNEHVTSRNFYWIKGLVVALIAWLLIFLISEHYYFYGRSPELWKILFFGRGEYRALWIYLVIGIILGWIYGKIKNRNKPDSGLNFSS